MMKNLLESKSDCRKYGMLELPQPPLMWVQFPEDENKKIKSRCLDILNSEDKISKNKDLAGNIKHEYVASDDITKFFLNSVSSTIEELLNSSFPKDHRFLEEKEWTIDSCWINFQRKTEFNPLHYHSSLFSFVYWVQIPFDIKDEIELDFVKDSNSPSVSAFTFCYTNALGKIIQKEIIAKEGLMVIFPAKMNHQVYPFYTSNQFRISISGNIDFNFKHQYSNIQYNELLSALNLS